MDIINKKNAVTESVNELLKSLNDIDTESNSVSDELNKKNEILNQMNKKLINEISDKDKLINVQQKSICDYEKQITSFIPVKEENKFGMVKAQAKEITNLTNTITILRKELEQVNSKLEVLSSNANNVSCEVIDLVEEEKVKEVKEEVLEEVDEVKEEVVKEVKEEVVKEVKEEVLEEVKKVEEVDSDESVDIDYITKKIKHVRYYVEKGNPNSKIYSILDNGEPGEIVGEIKDGKKKIYKK